MGKLVLPRSGPVASYPRYVTHLNKGMDRDLPCETNYEFPKLSGTFWLNRLAATRLGPAPAQHLPPWAPTSLKGPLGFCW